MDTHEEVKQWDESAHGMLSEDALRRMYVPAERYRISRRRYPAHTKFSGSMRPGLVYVLRGSCTYSFEHSVQLEARSIGNLPGGPYSFDVGDEDLEIVLVWELPIGRQKSGVR